MISEKMSGHIDRHQFIETTLRSDLENRYIYRRERYKSKDKTLKATFYVRSL